MDTEATSEATGGASSLPGECPGARLKGLVADLAGLVARPDAEWRGELVARLGHVRTLLADEASGPADWLQARRSTLVRERDALLDRVDDTRLVVLGADDLDQALHAVQRLVARVRHHLQRVSDVAWDEVEYEVGGSE